MDWLQCLAFGVLFGIVVFGIFILVQNILDINENIRLQLSIKIFNLIFISILAFPVIYLSSKAFFRTSSIKLLALSGAQLSLGIGSLLKGWLPDTNLSILIIIYESTVLLTSLIYLSGGIITIARPASFKLNAEQKRKVYFGGLTAVILAVALIVSFTFLKLIPSSVGFRGNRLSVQDILQILSTIILFITSLIYFRVYLKSNSDLTYWYCLSLLFLAFGVFFISQGDVESRIAWVGRASQYFGNICFLAGLIRNYKQEKINTSKIRYSRKPVGV
ncbi:MAG: hypothetical protein ABSF32_08455 [Ignavibacteria bacterium]